MPTITGLSHVSLSVRDLAASVRWYGEVFGFVPHTERAENGWVGYVCFHPESLTLLNFQQHEEATGDLFDQRRTGMDHFAFAVADRAALEEWERRLASLGVTYTPAVEVESRGVTGAVLCLRDPDDIQVELFVLDLPA